MSHLPKSKLGNAVRSYLKRPDFEATRLIEEALQHVELDAALVIRPLLELVIYFHRRAAKGEEDAKKMEMILHEALGAKIINIQQQGQGNVAQSGDGIQTVTPSPT